MYRFKIKKDKAGEFRWTLESKSIAGIYKTVADSGEGYKNFADCHKEIMQIKMHAQKAEVLGK